MFVILIDFIFFFFSIIIMTILPIILMSIIRVYFIKSFLPNYNYDQQFFDYSIENKNYSYILITTKLEDEVQFNIIQDYYRKCIDKYLNKNNFKLPAIDFENKKITTTPICSVDEIIFEDIEVNQALKVFDYSIKMLLDRENYICYIILSHVFHSGLSIANDMICNNNCNMIQLPNIPKYIPFYNEFLILEFAINYLYYSKDVQIPKLINNHQYKDEVLPAENLIVTDCHLPNLLNYKKNFNDTRDIKTPFIVYPLAKICYLICSNLDSEIKKKKKYFKVVILVGYNNDNVKLKNNFSFININIPMNQIPTLTSKKDNDDNIECKKKLDNFILFLFKEINKRKTDAMTSYNLLNYYYSLVNNSSKISDSMIDLNFSAVPELKLDEQNTINTQLLINTHVQPINLSTPIYSFTYSINGLSKISYTINTKYIDLDGFKALDKEFLDLFY